MSSESLLEPPPATQPIAEPKSTPLPTPEQILAKYSDRPVGTPMSRSGFLSSLGMAWVAFTAMLGGAFSTLFCFMIPRVNFERTHVYNVGPPDKYSAESVDNTYKPDRFWVVRDTEKVVALLSICTHLGCTPNWQENENKFKCPCHGSGFRGPKNGQLAGINFEGPAPVPLRRCKIWLNDEGSLVVDRDILFMQEKGEWENPQSFVLV